jgi:flagella basal body P-ring formation protein FlgA
VSTGDEVRVGDVGAKPAVAEMSRVSVQVAVGAVVLRTPGIALADAAVGEQVKVRPNGSAQTVLARVIGPQTVVIDEGTNP